MNQLNEYEVIELFKPHGANNSEIVVGIGDDCAVLKKSATHYTLISKDLFIEDIHFRLSTTNPVALAHKVLNCNISDIAACGGSPLFLLLAIACPNNTAINWLKTFGETLQKICKPYNVTIIGGDTSRSPHKLYLSITIMGEVPKEHLKLRSSAKAGDYIAVTGNLGEASLGLYALENKKSTHKFAPFIAKQNNTQARSDEGKWLGSQKAITAMMDVSDGLDTDLHRMITASYVGAEIEISRLPYCKTLLQLALEYNLNLYDLLLGGGEDYELLVTISPEHIKTLPQEFTDRFKISLSVIGKMTQGSKLEYLQEGRGIDLTVKKFNHFGG